MSQRKPNIVFSLADDWGNGPTWYETTPWPLTLYNDSDEVWAANSSRLAVDATVDFMKQESDKPFFVNLWLKDSHAPLHPTEEQRKPLKRLSEPYCRATSSSVACR